MIQKNKFFYTLMKRMIELTNSETASNPEKLDKKAYKLAKALVAEYECDSPENIEAPYEADGMVFHFLKGDRHFTRLNVEFVGMRNSNTEGGVPMAEFEFEIIDGPYAGKHIIHMSVHTKSFKHQYKTEENFVKGGLKYNGPYDAKEAEENSDYATLLNERLPGKYVYEVEYFPIEGKHKDTKIKIIDARPIE